MEIKSQRIRNKDFNVICEGDLDQEGNWRGKDMGKKEEASNLGREGIIAKIFSNMNFSISIDFSMENFK